MGVPSPWVRIKIGLDKNRRPLNKMSWKWTVQLNKTSIRWTSIRTVCMESPLQGSLWPLTSASHMTIHNPKSELWPLFYLWICLEVYTEIYFVLIRPFSLFLFSQDSNSGLILCFCKVLFHSISLFFDVHPSEIFFLFAKIISKASRFSQVQDSNFSPSKIFENVLFCLFSFEMFNSRPFFCFLNNWLLAQFLVCRQGRGELMNRGMTIFLS